MTIAAGFKCTDGIVLCADTQETVGDFLKRSEPKIVIRATGGLDYGEVKEMRAVFACAGHGPFIDMTVDKVWKQMREASHGESAVIEALENELISVHQSYWPLYEKEQRPEIEMLIAIYTPGTTPSLWKAIGPIVNRVETYDCIGYGLGLGKYIGDRLYNTQIMWETEQAALLSIYLLEQAKSAVQYCGGESHVVIMPLTGWICPLTQDYVGKTVSAFNTFERETNRLLLKVLELKFDEAEVLRTWANFYDGLPELEGKIRQLLQEAQDFMSKKSVR